MREADFIASHTSRDGVIRMPSSHTGRIRVLTMITSFHIGGTERQVTNVSLGLDRTRFDLHLACMRDIGELKRELDGVLNIPRPVFDIGSLYSFRTLKQAKRLARYIRDNGIHVVHTYGLYPNIFAVPVARLAGAPIVIASIRDCGDILKPWQRRAQKTICALADCVLVNADAIRDTLIKQGYRAEKIAVIRNAVTPANRAGSLAEPGIRAEMGWDSNAPVVIVLSRLNRMKGIEYFLEAAKLVGQRIAAARFLVIGDGAIKRELQDRASALGLADKVIFTGFRTDVGRLLQQANLSVLPSLSEGLSNALLESMAAGVPVIATSVGGNPEVVEDGVSGLLVPPKDPTSLADAMLTLLEKPALAARYAAAGSQRIDEMFSVKQSVARIESLYRQLVDGPNYVPLEAAPVENFFES
ncbi:MAG: glycosyltransferase [Bryobacterales bacterium]|nr:glycosyltransferase [Bryobacterales bacterium]MBV9398783.1 glycosyltransferase [Bryobacterales bacterium]